jgi:hypothetical protein
MIININYLAAWALATEAAIIVENAGAVRLITFRGRVLRGKLSILLLRRIGKEYITHS